MNPIEHNGRLFSLVRGSDLQRDGMFLELWSAQNPRRQLCEVFYSDVTHTMSFSCFVQDDIPFEVMEQYLKQSRYLLTPMPDDTEQGGK